MFNSTKVKKTKEQKLKEKKEDEIQKELVKANVKKIKRKRKKQREKLKKSNQESETTNKYCSNCPHRPPQSLTPKDARKYQKERSYDKLYNLI